MDFSFNKTQLVINATYFSFLDICSNYLNNSYNKKYLILNVDNIIIQNV